MGEMTIKLVATIVDKTVTKLIRHVVLSVAFCIL